MFFRGLIYWLALVAVLSALGFGFWKYLTSVLGYENRKREIALGVSCIVLSFSAFLFTPVILSSSENLVRNVVEKLQENVAKNSEDEYSKNVGGHLKDFADRMVANHPAPLPEFSADAVLPKVKIEESVSDAVEFARKKAASSNVSVAQSLDCVADYLQKEDVLAEVPAEDMKKEIKGFVCEVFAPYCEDARKSFDSDMAPVMKRFFKPAVDASSFEGVSGVPDGELLNGLKDGAASADKWLSKMLPGFFIIVTVVSAAFCLVFLVVILILLREPESRREDEFSKNHIFEYKESVFADINKEKK